MGRAVGEGRMGGERLGVGLRTNPGTDACTDVPCFCSVVFDPGTDTCTNAGTDAFSEPASCTDPGTDACTDGSRSGSTLGVALAGGTLSKAMHPSEWSALHPRQKLLRQWVH